MGCLWDLIALETECLTFGTMLPSRAALTRCFFPGKLGAFAGSLLFKEAVTVLEGVGPVLVICALFSLAGETAAFSANDVLLLLC